MRDILENGKIPISNVKNSAEFSFRGLRAPLYDHPYARAVADILTIDMIN
jgi:flagellar basal body L-ring protein FlgH